MQEKLEKIRLFVLHKCGHTDVAAAAIDTFLRRKWQLLLLHAIISTIHARHIFNWQDVCMDGLKWSTGAEIFLFKHRFYFGWFFTVQYETYWSEVFHKTWNWIFKDFKNPIGRPDLKVLKNDSIKKIVNTAGHYCCVYYCRNPIPTRWGRNQPSHCISRDQVG